MPKDIPASDLLSRVFDPESFRRDGHRLVDLLADYLGRIVKGESMPVLPWVEPDRMVASWPDAFEESPTGKLMPLLTRVLAEANHLHHPHYMGHQVPGPLPMAALCDLVSSWLNNGMAVYEMGMAGTAMERHVVRWMSDLLGLGSTADGVLTSGGSVGNLTALLAMRQARSRQLEGRPPAVLVSDQTHYSVLRAVKILGWGAQGAIAVPSDDRFKLRVDLLDTALQGAESKGMRVIGVVASACTTATGSYDPIDAIAAFCQAHGLWLHVDAAHGAPAAISEKYRHRLDGIERADSVVFDAHKMLLMPALVTAVLFKNGEDSYRTFEDRASYLLEKSAREEWYNIGHRTMECTKRMLALKVYAALVCFGTRLFAEYVTRQYDLGRRFAEMLDAATDFELAVEPESNIVCFRHTPEGCLDPDALQARIRAALVKSGRFYIVQTRLPKGLHLRVTLINPLTTEEHLRALMDAIRREALESGAGDTEGVR